MAINISTDEIQRCVSEHLMNSYQADCYVTDLETDEILYMNPHMCKVYKMQEYAGKVCWKVLQVGMKERCDFCPVRKMQKNGTTSMQWEEKHPISGHMYENMDQIITLPSGKKAHLHYSRDINANLKVMDDVNIDELTGMLTRRAGKEALAVSLFKVQNAGIPFVVCMYDLNNLKYVNDTYGHGEGDTYLSMVSKAVNKSLGKLDYALRFGGDEFIAVYENIEEIQVVEKLEGILETLERMQIEMNKPYEVSFCYGTYEVKKNESVQLQHILEIIDERMYKQKRRYHIQAAQERVKMIPKQSLTKETFKYNADQLYDALIKSTDDYIYVCDMETGVFRYSPAMVDEFALPDELIEHPADVWSEKIHEEDRQAFMEANQEIADDRCDEHCVEYRARNKNGEWVWLRCRGHLMRDEQGKPSLFAGIITNLAKKNKIDHLTGLLNRYEFESYVKKCIEDSEGERISALVLDLDSFQQINDLYDRSFGDDILRLIAQRLQRMLPTDTTIFRMDGDEFGIVFQGASEEEIREFYKNVQLVFDKQQVHDNKKYFVTFSGGCASYPNDGDNYLDILQKAMYCLEYTKQHGKNNIMFFAKEFLKYKKRNLSIMEILRESIGNGFLGFEVHYQPVVTGNDYKIFGIEALARFYCEEYGNISPAEFIPLLEESGLIIPLGRWVFKRAAEFLAVCMKKQNRDVIVSVNLSLVQLEDEGLLEYMLETVKKAGVSPNNITLEMTESSMASSYEDLAQYFASLRAAGFRIAMDDFGTGYSSLSVLKETPADIVKIDREFIKNIHNNTFDITFVKFVTEICHMQGIKVCIEGIETEEQFEILRQLPVDYIQGFYFGKPVPEEHLELVEE